MHLQVVQAVSRETTSKLCWETVCTKTEVRNVTTLSELSHAVRWRKRLSIYCLLVMNNDCACPQSNRAWCETSFPRLNLLAAWDACCMKTPMVNYAFILSAWQSCHVSRKDKIAPHLTVHVLSTADIPVARSHPWEGGELWLCISSLHKQVCTCSRSLLQLWVGSYTTCSDVHTVVNRDRKPISYSGR